MSDKDKIAGNRGRSMSARELAIQAHDDFLTTRYAAVSDRLFCLLQRILPRFDQDEFSLGATDRQGLVYGELSSLPGMHFYCYDSDDLYVQIETDKGVVSFTVTDWASLGYLVKHYEIGKERNS